VYFSSHQINYNGKTYGWPDICANFAGTEKFTYEIPCARLSPMDLFQEAKWFMDYTGPDSTSDDPHIPAPKEYGLPLLKGVFDEWTIL
jgi:hypothetical protein